MSFSRWYPVSNQYYDPAIQPTKPMMSLQKNESQFKRVPKGRYETTYRREYLNFQQKYYKPTEKVNKASLNNYTVLPPISHSQGNSGSNQDLSNSLTRVNSIDHIIRQAPSLESAENYGAPVQANDQSTMEMNQQMMNTPRNVNKTNFLPREPLELSSSEENSLAQDVTRELSNFSGDQLKSFYSELVTYDPNVTGYVHHMYITLSAMRNKLPLNDSLMRFLMSKFVSRSKDPDHVNYEELVKYLARCIGQKQQAPQVAQYYQKNNSYGAQQVQNSYGENIDSTRLDPSYDPDEQAILHLMHENMKDWNKSVKLDTDKLRKEFYEIDYMKKFVLNQKQIEDVLYRNRIPIQRSLIYQITEKYCKVSTGLYNWPKFIDFLERTDRLHNKAQQAQRPQQYSNNQAQYGVREDDKEVYSSENKYRTNQLESLRRKVTEEERLEEIERQIYNLQSLKHETQQRIDSRLDDVVRGESWFTRFMRLANAMYSHRVNAGIEFALPKDEARELVNAYNTVYDLKVPDYTIEEGLHKCTKKGNVIIDDLLKVLSKLK